MKRQMTISIRGPQGVGKTLAASNIGAVLRQFGVDVRIIDGGIETPMDEPRIGGWSLLADVLNRQSIEVVVQVTNLPEN